MARLLLQRDSRAGLKGAREGRGPPGREAEGAGPVLARSASGSRRRGGRAGGQARGAPSPSRQPRRLVPVGRARRGLSSPGRARAPPPPLPASSVGSEAVRPGAGPRALPARRLPSAPPARVAAGPPSGGGFWTPARPPSARAARLAPPPPLPGPGTFPPACAPAFPLSALARPQGPAAGPALPRSPPEGRVGLPRGRGVRGCRCSGRPGSAAARAGGGFR